MEVEIPIIRSIPFVLRQYLAISVNIGFHNVSACRLNFHQYYRQLACNVNYVFSFGGRAGGGRFLIDAITDGVVFEFDGVIAWPFGLPQLIIPVEGICNVLPGVVTPTRDNPLSARRARAARAAI